MISDNDKEKFLEELRKTSLITNACNKTGIGRATVYRWKKDDPQFKRQMIEAQSQGRDLMCDAAESVILAGIKNKDFRAAAHYLKHNDPRYMENKYTVEHRKLDEKQSKRSEGERIADTIEALAVLRERHGEAGVKKILSGSDDKNTGNQDIQTNPKPEEEEK